MYNIENKKIAVSLILMAVFGIVLCMFLKQDIYIPTTSRVTVGLYENVPNDYKFIKQIKTKDAYQPEKAIYEYDSHYIIDGVSIIGLEFRYKSLVTVFIILLGISIYILLYKTDDEIKYVTERYRVKLRNYFVNFNKKKISKTNTIVPQVSENDLTLYKKIRWAKNLALISGYILLLIQVILFIQNQEKLYVNANEYERYALINLVASYSFRVYGAILIYDMSKYNRGNKYIWMLFGFFIPSISLIISGMTRTLQYEYKYLYEFINQPKIK